MRKPDGIPSYGVNLYSTAAIFDPHYARLRELGPVVWLTKHRVYALPRYAECKAVLRDDQTFEHDKRRKLVAHRLLPRALRSIDDAVKRRADQLVAAAVARPHVDGVEDLATALPLSVVPSSSAGPRTAGRTSCVGVQPHSTRWARSTDMQPGRCSTAAWATYSASGTERMHAPGKGWLVSRCRRCCPLLQRVDRIELTAEPSWAVNNVIRCYQRPPLRLISA